MNFTDMIFLEPASFFFLFQFRKERISIRKEKRISNILHKMYLNLEVSMPNAAGPIVVYLNVRNGPNKIFMNRIEREKLTKMFR